MNSPYKNSRYSSYKQTGKSMLQFLRSDIFQQNLEQSEVALSLCHKLNESGNGYNERLLVLRTPNGYIGYSRGFEAKNILPIASERDFPVIKQKILMESIVEHWTQDDMLKIKFRDAESKQPKTWCFRMSSPNMAYLWDNRVMDARTKSLQIHNKTQTETDVVSQRSSQLRISSILNQQITPSKQPQLSVISEKSLNEPFTVHPQQSQVVANPLQVSNVLPISPLDGRTDHEEDIWVFPEFKEAKGGTFKKNKSASSIPIQPQSKDNSLTEQQSALRKSVDDGAQLERFLNCEWSYQFLQSDESELIQLFEEFSERLVVTLVDQMMLPNNFQAHRPKFKDTDHLEYAFQFVTVKMAFAVPTTQGVYNQSARLRLKHEFRNMDYILSCLGNEQPIRIPLCALIDYKGICSLVIVNTKTLQTKLDLKIIGNHLNQLSARAKIKPSIFSDRDSVVIVQADMDYYNKLAKQNGDAPFKDILYFLTDVNSFLPQDVFFDQSHQPDSVNLQIRPEFLSRLESPVEGRMLKASMNPTEYKQVRKELDQLSTLVLSRIDQITEQFNQSPNVVILPNDLIELLHSKGLGIRYLGILYQNLQNPQHKRIIMSDIISRSLQSVIKGRLCSETLMQTVSLINKELNIQKYLFDRNTQLISKLVDMFMRLLTEKSEEMEMVWEEINRTALSKFNKCIDRLELELPYFYFAILRGSSLKVDWRQISKDFRPDNIGKPKLFNGFALETQVYSLLFMEKAQNLRRLLSRPDNLKEVRNLLGLDDNEIVPTWATKANLHKDIVKYHMVNQIFNERYLGLVEGQLLGSFELNFFLSQLKMELQQGKIAKADQIRDQLFKQIKRSVGSQSHPFICLVFEAYSEYFEKQGKLEQALLKAKNSLIIRIKYSGLKAHQHSSIYQRIAMLLVKLDRRAEAVDYYRRIKTNLPKNTQKWTDATIKQASLQRTLGRLNVIESDLIEAFEYIKYQRPLDEQRLVLLADLLNECLTTPIQAQKFSNFISKLQTVTLEIDQPQYLEGIFKHIVRHYLKKVTQPVISSFLSLIKELTAKQSKNYNYGYSVKIIKQRLAMNKLWNNLRQYINQLDKILAYINQKQLLKSWKGFLYAPNDIFQDFLVIVSILLYFLGQDFIESTLVNQNN